MKFILAASLTGSVICLGLTACNQDMAEFARATKIETLDGAIGGPKAIAQPGDLLLIRDTGAYTLSMWSRHCSRGLPPTWGYRARNLTQLHRGEQPQDVVDFWSMK